MNNRLMLWRRNRKCARSRWGKLDTEAMGQLKFLTIKYCLSLMVGEIQLLNNRWYVTHAGLLGIAQRKKCFGIRTMAMKRLSDPTARRWVFEATVFKSPSSMGFVGYGDADPGNVSPLVRGTELRVAETRAVCRALRRAYALPICSLEELKDLSSPSGRMTEKGSAATHSNGNGSGNGQPRLRDRLCLLIRKYELDPSLVKRYAADFCGTQELRDAGRDLVEAFISTVAEEAAKDRAALVCKLNSYS
jgi:hypothetical protein